MSNITKTIYRLKKTGFFSINSKEGEHQKMRNSTTQVKDELKFYRLSLRHRGKENFQQLLKKIPKFNP